MLLFCSTFVFYCLFPFSFPWNPRHSGYDKNTPQATEISYRSEEWKVQERGARKLSTWWVSALWFKWCHLLVSSRAQRDSIALFGFSGACANPIQEALPSWSNLLTKTPSPILLHWWRGFNTSRERESRTFWPLHQPSLYLMQSIRVSKLPQNFLFPGSVLIPTPWSRRSSMPPWSLGWQSQLHISCKSPAQSELSEFLLL